MSSTTKDTSLTVRVSADRMQAELFIPANFVRPLLTEELLTAQLADAGVQITDQVTARIRAIIEHACNTEGPVQQIIAKAQLPKHGRDGRIDWTVQADTQNKSDSPPPTDEADSSSHNDVTAEAPEASETDALNDTDDSVAHPDELDQSLKPQNYYERCAFTMVKSGDVIGYVYEATEGIDGKDVTGKRLPAKNGKSATLQIDDTIVKNAQGQLIAQAQGVVHVEGNRASIRQLLEIPENVDFSTGNLDFPGDVIIRQGIKDCFVVRAKGNVEVGGLIEAATVEAGGDFHARGGFAGRERGRCKVGNDLYAKYLDNIQGDVHGNMHVDREIVNCEITVHGDIQSPTGTIIGGKVTCSGEFIINTLGSPAGVETLIELDVVPRLDRFLIKLDRLIERFKARKEKIEAEQQQIAQLTVANRKNYDEQSREFEIKFELDELNNHLNNAIKMRAVLKEEINIHRKLKLTVERKLNAGVILKIRNRRFHITCDMKGPLEIRRDMQQNIIVMRHGGRPGPLSQIAEVR